MHEKAGHKFCIHIAIAERKRWSILPVKWVIKEVIEDVMFGLNPGR